MLHRLPRSTDTPIDNAAMEVASQIETDARMAQAAMDAFDCPDEVRTLIDALLTGGIPPVADWPKRLQVACSVSADAALALADRLRIWLEAFDYARAAQPGHLAIDTVLSNAVAGLRRSQPGTVSKAS